MSDKNLDHLYWPASKLSDIIEALARQSGLMPRSVEIPAPTTGAMESPGPWIDATARRLGLEVEEAESPYANVEAFVRNAGPALIRMPGEGEPRFLAVLGGSRRGIRALAPDLRVHTIALKSICAELCREIEAPVSAETEDWLDQAGLSGRRRGRARAALLRERFRFNVVGGCWLFRLPPNASFRQQMRQARLPRLLMSVVASYALQLLLMILAWGVLGNGVLNGRVDRGWLIAWALLLLTAVPARLVATWAQGRFAIMAGSLLKERLLYGALRLEPEEIRHEGTGQILSRMIESSNIESLALNGGFLGAVALIELIVAGVILSAGAGGLIHVLLLLSWIAVVLLIGWRYYRQRHRWTQTRLDMTNDLIERMVGHRTRLAQEPREHWHDGEDQSLERYLQQSKALDRVAMIEASAARGWLVLGLLGLVPAFVAGTSVPTKLAISLGGMLLGFMALERLTQSMSSLLGAAMAWQQIASLFNAAGRAEEVNASVVPVRPRERQPDDDRPGDRLIDGHDLTFRYARRGEPVLRGVDLQIYRGERLLLQGSSGGGKSTLVSLLTGLRAPDSGLLLLDGLDYQTLGAEGWRQRVASAPQFHENHVLTGTFAFNLLMGRQWPPRQADFVEAETICRELGLGDLLDRMPAGMLQMVGETGWQLSHGERSRLFMARALLQGADLVILDESFAALDPETMRQCLECAQKRASTLLVIAHP